MAAASIKFSSRGYVNSAILLENRHSAIHTIFCPVSLIYLFNLVNITTFLNWNLMVF